MAAAPSMSGRGLDVRHGAPPGNTNATTVHDLHPDRPQLPDDCSIEDANADLF
jgi:hypothetical protein